MEPTELNINYKILEHMQKNILPKYDYFDKAHNSLHVNRVIKNSLSIASVYNVDISKVYVIAAYHDIGLINGRKNHEKTSAEYLLLDESLKSWFSNTDLIEMSEAIEDHRASSNKEPRSIYGKIVAEADRDIDYHTILTRVAQFSLEHYPNYTIKQHFDRAYSHMQEKYGEEGYLKLWLDTEPNRSNLAEIRKALLDRDRFETELINIINNENLC